MAVTKEKVAESLKEMTDFQNSEAWRKPNGDWRMDIESGVNLRDYENDHGNYEESSVDKSDALLDVTKALASRKYLVVEQTSDEIGFDGSLPITIGLADGKDVYSALTAEGITTSYVYGPTMANEIDMGYLPKGVYLLRIKATDGYEHTGRVAVSK